MWHEADRGRLLWAVLALGSIAGCQGMFARPGLPQDPLLLDKTPHEARAVTAPPVTLAYSEPVAPSNPYFSEPPPTLVGPRRSTLVPGILTNRLPLDRPDEEEEDEP